MHKETYPQQTLPKGEEKDKKRTQEPAPQPEKMLETKGFPYKKQAHFHFNKKQLNITDPKLVKIILKWGKTEKNHVHV